MQLVLYLAINGKMKPEIPSQALSVYRNLVTSLRFEGCRLSNIQNISDSFGTI